MNRLKELGLTQAQLAAKTDLTTQTASTAERCIKGLWAKHMVEVCNALYMTTDYLLLGKVPLSTQQQLISQQEAYLLAIVEIFAVTVTQTDIV